ncbi:PTTG1 interacting protein b isoform X2 [Nematolebias whitei]|nr:PTTG1 interacting protein b isoform X2 [Nematolebias whitei]
MVSFPAACVCAAAVFCAVFSAAGAQTPTPSPAPCHLKSNSTCAECLQTVACLWCITTKQCLDYPVKNILPPSSVCPLNDARWGVCWVNFQILIITMSVLAGIVVVSVVVCCLCCCCKCERAGNKREDEQAERQQRGRKSRQKAR